MGVRSCARAFTSLHRQFFHLTHVHFPFVKGDSNSTPPGIWRVDGGHTGALSAVPATASGQPCAVSSLPLSCSGAVCPLFGCHGAVLVIAFLGCGAVRYLHFLRLLPC
jgi:hypothetical protein